MNIFLEENPNMVAMQKFVSYIGDCLRTLEYTFWKTQYAKCKTIKNVRQEIEVFKIHDGGFTSCYFTLTFIHGKNKMLPQVLDHTFHKKKSFSFQSLIETRTIILPSSTLM